MTGQQLRNSILQEAIQGRLVPNVLEPGEKTGPELLQAILSERQKKENDEKGKKAKKLTLSTIEVEPWELPNGWCWCKLEDVCTITAGQSPDGKDINEQEGVEFHQGKIYFDELYLKKANIFTKQVTKIAHKDSVLLCMRAPVGVVNITPREICIGRGLSALEPSAPISTLFFCYLLRSYKDYFEDKATGSTFKAITVDVVKNTPIPLPPLSIQNAIVKKIEDLFPLVDEYDKAAGELETLNKFLPDKLRKSVLQEAIHGNLVPNDIPDGEATAPELLQQILKERQDRENKEKGKKAKKLTLSTIEEEPWNLPEGWCWCKLGDIFEMQAGKNISASEIHDTKSDDYPYPCFGGNGVRGYVKNYNTIGIHTIVGRQGALCGNVKYAEGPFYATEHAVVVSMNYCDVMWSYHFLIACDLNQYATKTAQPGLSVAKVLDTYFPLPPLSVQHRIVEKIEEVFAAINTLKFQ